MEQTGTITVISTTNITLFKGLSQTDLSGKNPADHNRLNIKPDWSYGLEPDGTIKRFNFVIGENSCPEYIIEWDSFKSLVNNGTLSIKGSLDRHVESKETKSLKDLNASLEKKVKELEAKLKEQEKKDKETTKIIEK